MAYVDEGQADAVVLRHLVSGQGAVGEVIGQAELTVDWRDINSFLRRRRQYWDDADSIGVR
ncbi:MAG: hypothetical protein JWR34_593 [Mycobacterium sp.]|jgi:hypothetical protein|nr:hypothetical protein [Mycobacterium sp.]